MIVLFVEFSLVIGTATLEPCNKVQNNLLDVLLFMVVIGVYVACGSLHGTINV